MRLTALEPTVFLRGPDDALEQRVRVTVTSPAATAGRLRLETPAGAREHDLGELPAGESRHEALIPVMDAPGDVIATLFGPDGETDRVVRPWQPPRRWTVHVVQLSHHDVGYTNLASNVIPEHDRWLDAAIDMAAGTRDWPDAARFRIVVEQSWSIDHFLRHAPADRRAAMLDLLRAGDIEVTALFGNLTTELCGHETLVRSLYPAFRLYREHGIPIVSAENNDIPGFAWGLAEALVSAGIQIFCPGLPKYYNWGGKAGASSFWDAAALLGGDDLPGAFWWEAPSGGRVLLWCNNRGCGGPCDPQLPDVGERLRDLETQGYPWDVLRWPVQGGARDNSPYIPGFARAVREWNARWRWPRLISSTNARFYRDLLPRLPDDLPVHRGEVPGQDYPVGAASTAAATAVNRANHRDLPAAETLATVAAAWTDFDYPAEEIDTAHREVLWHDEHTWGHHFPAGPSAANSELEKAVHAHRAAALTHDVTNRALARLADRVHVDEPGLHLVVFNPAAHTRDAVVTTPLREIDNCGSTMAPNEAGLLRGYLLGDRWHLTPPPAIAAGQFDLVDVATGAAVPFQIVTHNSSLGPVPWAAQRLGLGQGGKRYGFFEVPDGLTRDLVFRAEGLPAVGYRTYRLEPRDDAPAFSSLLKVGGTSIESPFFRLELDPAAGFVCRLLDKQSGRELVDPEAPHAFGTVLVRGPSGAPHVAADAAIQPGECGPLTASLRVRHTAWGHPQIETTWMLHATEPRLEVAVGMVKDPTPLLESYLAFPFAMPDAQFRIEGPLAVTDPATDRLPGAYADRLTVQDWLSVSDEAGALWWQSLDAPVVGCGRLWPGRVSPAHSAVVRDDLDHPVQAAADLCGGHVYSLLTANNFGTNFAVSQSGTLLFRYRLTTASPDRISVPTIFTEASAGPGLEPTGNFLAVDDPRLRLLVLKRAADGRGLIARFWNPGTEPVRLRLPAVETTLAEVDVRSEADQWQLGPGQVRTFRLPTD